MQTQRPGGGEVPPARHHLLLAGGGHSHALVLLGWAMDPSRRPAATRITLVSRHGTAIYSGMVPGVVAGLHPREDAAIDLRRLCAAAGATFVQAEIAGLDPRIRELRLEGRPPLRFDRLSLDVGAVTATDPAGSGGTAMAVKPLEPFLRWSGALPPGSTLRIRGGGAAAVELALAFRARGLLPRLLLRGRNLHLGSSAANRRGEAMLAIAGIPVERHVPEEAVADLACTGSRSPAWLATAGLPVEPATGRVRTERSLAVVGHPHLFAAGDCGVIEAAPRPPSGVWAVRAAAVLAENLRRSLECPQAPLRSWRPQGRALQLLGDGGACAGEPGALALWGPLAIGPSRWLWRWKEGIDRRFLERFSPHPHPLAIGKGEPMACRGCAAKLAGAPLTASLARLATQGPGAQGPAPRLPGEAKGTGGVQGAEDAALVTRTAEGDLLLQSVDGFPALVEDPWLNARLTALHACGDLWACGAAVASAQALVTVPREAEHLQEEVLLQTLAGLRSVLDPLGAALLGGHTLEGRDGGGLAVALTVNGLVAPERHWPKGPLHPGDVLLLSRPIGSGVLFAAAMAEAAVAGWIDEALTVLQQSQAPLVDLLAAHGCRACTDITGFGLLGHLGEMLTGRTPGQEAAGAVRVRLDGSAVPALPGALELLERGHASSLAPANAAALALLEGPVDLAEPPETPASTAAARRDLLLDPQTCGPLLAAVPAERAAGAVRALRAAGFPHACVVAQVQG